MPDQNPPTPIRVGQIVASHGLKGQVRVQPLTEFGNRFDKGARLLLKGEWVTVETSSIHKGRPLLKLSGVEHIDQAEKLQWEYLEAIGAPELEEDEFLVEDLLGCKVYTESGEFLGEVDDVLDMPAHEVLEVGEILIPLIKHFVLDIDLEAEKLIVRLIPGMRPGEDE